MNDEAKAKALDVIRSSRIASGLSVNAASIKSSISQSNWCRIENGLQNPTWDTLCKMADAVGAVATIRIKHK